MQQSSNNTNANTSVVPGPGNVTNSTATGASSPSAPDGCVAVAGMSTGANSTTWWPYVLKQLFNGSAEAQMPIGAPLYGSSGSYGAAVTINNASRKAWHVQLSSQPALMGRGDYYAVKFAARSSATTVLQVAVVEDSTWQVGCSKLSCTTLVPSDEPSSDCVSTNVAHWYYCSCRATSATGRDNLQTADDRHSLLVLNNLRPRRPRYKVLAS